MKTAKFNFLDHTGDIGLQIRGETLEDIFSAAATGMVSIITESKLSSSENEYSFSLQADSYGDLLIYWLSHLNFLFATEGLLFRRVEKIVIRNYALESTVSGEIFSPERHEILREIKAVTYHQLILEQRQDGWFAQVIFDI